MRKIKFQQLSSAFMIHCLLILLLAVYCINASYPEQGKWDFRLNHTQQIYGIHKSLFKGSQYFIRAHCEHSQTNPHLQVNITWVVRMSPCWGEYAMLDIMSLEERSKFWLQYATYPWSTFEGYNYKEPYNVNGTGAHACDATIKIPPYELPKTFPTVKPGDIGRSTGEAVIPLDSSSSLKSKLDPILRAARTSSDPILTVPEDGIYLLIVKIEPVNQSDANDYNSDFHVEIKADYGYLSAGDYPLLRFYGIMCAIYLVMSFAWIILCAFHWRDILRLQLWISAVAILGLVEMTFFYAEYQSINSTGSSVPGAVLLAEIISCGKRTLARLLVVIVSIGFGIVKPRLGETLHRIVAVGLLYFLLASIEAGLRILHPLNDPQNRVLMANLALSLLDASICWWIFHSLVATTRTLRLRRNLVKLSLYRHFTNTLIFAIITSLGFMLWSIKFLKMEDCLTDWKDKWIDDAYWHMLFSVILFIIMLLWRPTNNNQRYSFSPLMDASDDEEEEELVVNESFAGNMKLRQKKSPSERTMKSRNADLEEELRWVDENIPNDFGEGDLPALDSDEELMTSKFELSKMQ